MTFFSNNMFPPLRNFDSKILGTRRQGFQDFWSQHPKPSLLSGSKASSSTILCILIISLFILSENAAWAQVKGIWDDQYTHA
ncbi:MAG: hypothetical protein K2X66_02755, partial [Cyanobacteria bacterium]|nr:hypothetical protein [Cyanobacteriota bacterium]